MGLERQVDCFPCQVGVTGLTGANLIGGLTCDQPDGKRLLAGRAAVSWTVLYRTDSYRTDSCWADSCWADSYRAEPSRRSPS